MPARNSRSAISMVLQGQPGQSMSGVRNSFCGESQGGWRKT